MTDLIPCKPKINGPLNAGWRCFASLTSTWFSNARFPPPVHAALKQIRYLQGTTEELRFFSLLLSLWALKHSTKRRLHWVRSWGEIGKDQIFVESEGERERSQVGCFNIKHAIGGSDSVHKQLVSLSWCWKSSSLMKDLLYHQARC